MSRRHELLKIYELLNTRFGDLHWWPAESPFEMMVGAILTQNTAWTNVEKAIEALRGRELLSPAALFHEPEERLARIIRPSGYYRLKAGRLKAFVTFLYKGYGGSLDRMAASPLPRLRNELLGVCGIGPETADSILLYGCGKPVFVVDAYTRRILMRHGMVAKEAGYDEIQALFQGHLPRSVSLFNQFHALIVRTGKEFCRKTKMECAACPLEGLLPAGEGRP